MRVRLKSGLALAFVVSALSCVSASARDYIVELKSEKTHGIEFSDREEIAPDTYVFDDFETLGLKLMGFCDSAEEDVPLQLHSEELQFYDVDYMQDMEISALKKISSKGEGVKVAVIDTGCNVDHEDLVGANIKEGYNYIINSTDVTDTKGHGTNVMGLLTAVEDNGIGIDGIATNAEYYPLCVYYNGNSSVSALIKAIYAAVDTYECDIINMSLGVNVDVTTLKKAIEYASSKGVILVASAGNDGATTYNYPASYPQVISVSSVNASYQRESFSQYNDEVDVTAPGVCPSLTIQGYKTYRGTSESAPIITGVLTVVAGEYKKDHPGENMDAFAVIKAATKDLNTSGRDDETGYGYLIATEALNFIKDPSNIFISPFYINSDNVNVKIYSPRNGTVTLIRSGFDDNVFDSATSEEITFEDNLYTNSEASGANEKTRLFAVSNMNTLKPVSNVREY
ncbi:MAG: S8 family serine peptidase [Firmicutes bacterium]|nr:S8 family serine peptidase [Bacillota bacterium]